MSFKNIDIYIAIVATLIALGQLAEKVLSFIAAVTPSLDIVFGDYADEVYIKVCNRGSGIARIRSIEIKYTNDIVYSSFLDIIQKSKSMKNIYLHEFTAPDLQITLNQNAELTLINYSKTSAKDSLREEISKCNIIIHYKSIIPFGMKKVSRKCNWFAR